jgi:hypothetical protein
MLDSYGHSKGSGFVAFSTLEEESKVVSHYYFYFYLYKSIAESLLDA